MNDALLNLPWQIQICLVSGYAAYMLSYRGIRSGHNALDATFRALTFGLIATLLLALLNKNAPILAGGVALTVTCVVGVCWRKYLRRPVHGILRALDITWANDDPSALLTISANSEHKLSQVAVQLDDGTWLSCDTLNNFEGLAFSPITIGPNGDIALYLTHEQKPGEERRALKTVRDPDWGDRLTYIPASRVRRLTLRHMPSRREPVEVLEVA